MNFWRDGVVKSIAPLKIFHASEIADSFRYMQKGVHMGKIVIQMPEDPTELLSTPVVRDLDLRPDASYLLVGGLGGLGRAITTWMVERGARRFVFLSRSADSQAHRAFLNELETQGCSTQIFSGSVSNLADVVNTVQNTSKPIAGVIQMSMVLRVSIFRHAL
jgi:hypothetical protein